MYISTFQHVHANKLRRGCYGRGQNFSRCRVSEWLGMMRAPLQLTVAILKPDLIARPRAAKVSSSEMLNIPLLVGQIVTEHRLLVSELSTVAY